MDRWRQDTRRQELTSHYVASRRLVSLMTDWLADHRSRVMTSHSLESDWLRRHVTLTSRQGLSHTILGGDIMHAHRNPVSLLYRCYRKL